MANLNSAGLELLTELVEAGQVDKGSPWEFASADADALLGEPPNWDRYGKVFLALDPDVGEETRERYKYPFAKMVAGKLLAFSTALDGIKAEAASAGEAAIAEAAESGAQAIHGVPSEDAAVVPDDPPPDDPPPPPPPKPKDPAPNISLTTEPNHTRKLLVEAPASMVGKLHNGYAVRNVYAGDVLYRETKIKAGAVDMEARTVEVAFSSTTPVDRYFGDEVLDHRTTAVRLDRLRNGAPVLVNHNPDDHVGVVRGETVRIESDGMGRTTLRFGRSARAAEILQDIADGIRPNVSVGYRVWDVETRQGESGREVATVTDWEPMEISIASVPADASVGVGRSVQAAAVPSVNINTNHQEGGRMSKELLRAELEKDRTRARNIRELGTRFEAVELATQFADAGKSEAEFHAALLERMGTPATLDDIKDRSRLGMSRKEMKSYSLFRVVEAMATNDWSKAGLEREAHDALQGKRDTMAKGILMPQDVLEFRDVEKGGGASGAALVGVDHLGGSYIDSLRARSVLANSGAKILDGLNGDVSIPRLATGAEFYIVNEGGALSASTPAWLAVTLSPYTIGTKVPITRRMLKQSSPAVEALVKQDIAKGMALRIDRYGLTGTGSGEPRGILYTSNVGLIIGGTDGVAMGFPHVVGMETEVAVENADIGNLLYIMHPRMRGHLKLQEKAANTAAFVWGEGGELNGYNAAVTTQLPDDLTKGTNNDCIASIFGNMSDLLIGLWGGLDLVLDTTSRDDGGHVLKAYQDMDTAARHGESFSVMLDGRAA